MESDIAGRSTGRGAVTESHVEALHAWEFR